MFVQSARTVEEHGGSPTRRLTFRGLEKNATTIRLAKMNLAVHGLEGDIRKAITYYEDPHELVGRADYVIANPPFNVDEIDAEKIKNDPRLPFGLPGINKHGKVSNGNYVWISYFHSYLNERGRAGFVMSSQASSAGRSEKTVRRKLIETGVVDLMIAIRPNFFYTRTVPCELWFLNRNKPEAQRDKVLMLDARSVYRQVTRKIYDFSPEQHKNLLSIVWLYRGESERFVDLVSDYLWSVVDEGKGCFEYETEDGDIRRQFRTTWTPSWRLRTWSDRSWIRFPRRVLTPKPSAVSKRQRKRSAERPDGWRPMSPSRRRTGLAPRRERQLWSRRRNRTVRSRIHAGLAPRRLTWSTGSSDASPRPVRRNAKRSRTSTGARATSIAPARLLTKPVSAPSFNCGSSTTFATGPLADQPVSRQPTARRSGTRQSGRPH